jgi:hypothetical protein
MKDLRKIAKEKNIRDVKIKKCRKSDNWKNC